MTRPAHTLHFAVAACAFAARALASDYVFVDGFEPLVDCSAPLACAAPSAGKTCLSGQLVEADSGLPVRALVHGELACGAGALGGACDLALSARDAFAFISNPGGSQPLASVERLVDGCGRFRFSELDPAPTGTVTIVTDDDPGSADTHVTTGAPRALGAGQRIDGVTVVVARRETVARWTQSAGSPFGASTFADVGSLLLAFCAAGAPRAGVTVTFNGGAVAAKDFYFADASASTRATVDSALTATGADGAALFANAALGQYSGTGGEPAGCTWPTVQGASAPGVVIYLEAGC